eukprot:TRINITY_DN29694_c0_g1_i1.p1 TRINITY_DN29694_c0_g1~~TRINITY_DN29694_c0_g1_i1.p1  ORF type:complete len:307 (-),score=33.21 TRINITY_DN29694_c0_g1_i1:212-1132(-)
MYFTTMIASLFLGNSIEEIQNFLEINILNTENDPKQHSEIQKVQQKIPFLKIQNSTQWDRGLIDVWHIRENYDYLAALKTCEKSSANWTIIFEEDIVLMNNFIKVFQQTISNNKQQKNFENVGYIKLWTTDRWDGFETQDTFLIIISSTFISIFLLIIFRYVWLLTILNSYNSFSKFEFLQIGFFIFLLILLNSQLIGKQQLIRIFSSQQHNLQILGRNHGSGTVAIAYSQTQLKNTIDYLQEVSLDSRIHIDVLIGSEMAKKFQKLKFLEVSPSLVQHIGVYSSGPKNDGDFKKLGWDSKFRMEC